MGKDPRKYSGVLVVLLFIWFLIQETLVDFQEVCQMGGTL